jgi:hypothetical protein
MRSAPLAALVLAAACSRGGDAAKQHALGGAPAVPPAPAYDLERPVAALSRGPDDLSAALGSFEWTASVEWSVSREGEEAQRVRAVERHRIRQAASGEFDVAADVDPGLGPGSETGRDVVYAGGMTYARAKHAPYRARPTDRGRDARRFRDESFAVPASLARLYGEALVAQPAGEATAAGRKTKRFKLSLARGAAPPAPAPRPPSAPAPDADTARRLRFLDGRVPLAADGELLLDAQTGAPLRVRLAGAFGVKDDPSARASVELLAQVTAVGAAVAAIAPPKSVRPDERKAEGVAGALDAAGLRKRAERKGAAEPADEPAE